MKHTGRLAIVSILLLGAAGATAGGPRDPRAERLLDAAYAVESATAAVHWQASRAAHHGSYPEAIALRRLGTLEAAARHFRRSLVRHGPSSPRTSWDFRELLAAYDRAFRAFPGLHADSRVRARMTRVSGVVHRLRDEYAVTLADRRHGRRHGPPHRPPVEYRYRDDDEDRDDRRYGR